MTKQDFFLKATAMLAQAFAEIAKADEPIEFEAHDIANRAAKAAAKLITAAETEWENIDAETPLFDAAEADPEGDTTTEDNDTTEGGDTEGAGSTEGGDTTEGAGT